MTKFGITYQEQPTPNTCIQTCLAMCLNEPVKNIIERYGEYAMNQQGLIGALIKEGVFFNQFVFGSMVYNGWYFACVPSLNIKGGLHEILIHSGDNGDLFVFDPSPKIKYKEDGSDLISWSDLTPFWN